MPRRATWIDDWERKNPGLSIRDELISLQERGYTQAAIGRLFKVDVATVNRALARFGLTTPRASQQVA